RPAVAEVEVQTGVLGEIRLAQRGAGQRGEGSKPMGLLQGPQKEFLGIAVPRTVKCNQKKPPPFGCISKEPGKSGWKGLPISGGLDYNNELIQKFCREAQVFAALGLYYSGREKVCKPQWQTI